MTKISNFSKAVMRTTAYSYSSILRILENENSDWLNNLLRDDYFITAIGLASPELLEKIKQIEEMDKESLEFKKLKRSILKYATRMATRCTPFGLFSGVGVIPITELEDQQIEISTKERHKKHFRLDMNFSVQLVVEISKKDILQNHLKFYPNTTIYALGENYRLVTYSIFNKMRSYELISVERNDFLDEILKIAKSGVLKSDLIDYLVQNEIEFEEAQDYINDLVASQILVSELEPTTIGLEVEIQLLEKLKIVQNRISQNTDQTWLLQIINYLETAILKLNQLNSESLKYNEYINLIDFLVGELPLEIVGLDRKFLVQCNVALEVSEKSYLSSKQVLLVNKAIDVLGHFQSKSSTIENTPMTKFKEAFQNRYEESFVPLVEALDVETGIGYGSRQESSSVDFTPFLSGIPVKYRTSEFEEIRWSNQFHPFWFSKFIEAKETKAYTVELTDEELKKFEKIEPRYASTFVAKTSFYKQEADDILFFEFYGGSTASTWYGRFCNSNKDLFDLNQEIIDYEADQNEDYLIAEVNHLPESRLGNVIHRAQGRRYQINYCAGFNSSEENQLEINDLYIGVRHGKVVLISKSQNKVVRTYHSNAFNSGMPSNLPIFQFLADLESEYGGTGGGLSFSSFHRFLKFIPRVTYKNIIFQRANWSFDKTDFDFLKKVTDDKLIEQFDQFRDKWILPEQFVIKAGDNELLIHAKNIDSILILIDEVKKSFKIQLTEFLPSSFDSMVKNEQGESFNNEVLLNFKMNPPQNSVKLNVSSFFNNEVEEAFPPGSEWIYYKLYMGVKVSDMFLIFMYEQIEALQSKGLIEKWFFIRYADPKMHLRLRLKLTNPSEIGEIMLKVGSLFEEFKQRYPIDKIVLDTYKRELERYGYNSLPLFESIFCEDSKMNIQLIAHCNQHERVDDLWLPAIYSLFTYCEQFGFDEKQIDQFIDWGVNAFRAEFNAYAETSKGLNLKYNVVKKDILSIFLNSEFNNFNSFKEIIQLRNENIKPMIAQIKNNYPLIEDQMRFLSSLVHMSVNRQFRSSQRMYEFVLYDFLKKTTQTLKHIKPNQIIEKII